MPHCSRFHHAAHSLEVTSGQHPVFAEIIRQPTVNLFVRQFIGVSVMFDVFQPDGTDFIFQSLVRPELDTFQFYFRIP